MCPRLTDAENEPKNNQGFPLNRDNRDFFSTTTRENRDQYILLINYDLVGHYNTKTWYTVHSELGTTFNHFVVTSDSLVHISTFQTTDSNKTARLFHHSAQYLCPIAGLFNSQNKLKIQDSGPVGTLNKFKNTWKLKSKHNTNLCLNSVYTATTSQTQQTAPNFLRRQPSELRNPKSVPVSITRHQWTQTS